MRRVGALARGARSRWLNGLGGSGSLEILSRLGWRLLDLCLRHGVEAPHHLVRRVRGNLRLYIRCKDFHNDPPKALKQAYSHLIGDDEATRGSSNGCYRRGGAGLVIGYWGGSVDRPTRHLASSLVGLRWLQHGEGGEWREVIPVRNMGRGASWRLRGGLREHGGWGSQWHERLLAVPAERAKGSTVVRSHPPLLHLTLFLD